MAMLTVGNRQQLQEGQIADNGSRIIRDQNGNLGYAQRGYGMGPDTGNWLNDYRDGSGQFRFTNDGGQNQINGIPFAGEGLSQGTGPGLDFAFGNLANMYSTSGNEIPGTMTPMVSGNTKPMQMGDPSMLKGGSGSPLQVGGDSMNPAMRGPGMPSAMGGGNRSLGLANLATSMGSASMPAPEMGFTPSGAAPTMQGTEQGGGYPQDGNLNPTMFGGAGGPLSIGAPSVNPSGNPAGRGGPGMNAGGSAAGSSMSIPAFNPNLSPLEADMGGLPALNTDFSGAARDAQRAVYDQATGLMQPDQDRERAALIQRMSNQGIPIGSEAYNGELDRFDRQSNLSRERAAQSAVLAGNTEAGNLFNRSASARSLLGGERERGADRRFSQGLGIANLGLQGRAQDIGAATSRYGIDSGNQQAGLSANLRLRELGLTEDNQGFQQLMQLLAGARGGLNVPNFGNTGSVDVLGANQLTQQGNQFQQNQSAQANAARNAGLFNLGATLLGGYFGGR